MPNKEISNKRRFPLGAEIINGEVHFRVWAPKVKNMEVVIEKALSEFGNRKFRMFPEEEGYFSLATTYAKAGDLYKFRLDDKDYLIPDPASRFQPEGPHGHSQIIDPFTYEWQDADWQGVSDKGNIVYEIHVGTFTMEGKWNSAMKELAELAAFGITVIEIMPIAEFPGKYGWGYDGVDLYAPSSLYGVPDDFRRFVDKAHSVGIGVILDVVYNHFGPDGNYLRDFSKDFFSTKHKTDWGEAINFDGHNSRHVRNFFIANAGYWIEEFHLDGLRLDATQDIFDDSEPHLFSEIEKNVRTHAKGKKTFVVAENEPQNVRLILPSDQNGHNLDAMWNDDFHHSTTVILTGRNEAYYTDYLGNPQELISAVKYGYLYQGQWYKWQKQRRGTPCLKIHPAKFVNYIQNHDQIANAGRGERCHVISGLPLFKAISTLLLLSPQTPLLFQGQEFASSSPFFYFSDHQKELAEKVFKGRIKFLTQFRSLKTAEMQSFIPHPADPLTYEKCKIDYKDREKNKQIYKLYKDLIRLRKDDPAFNLVRQGKVDGAVIGINAFVLRYFLDDGDDRLLIINLGKDYNFNPAPEPLLAPPWNKIWAIFFSTEDPQYGGCGTAPVDTEDNWMIPGRAAVLLIPGSKEEKKNHE